MYYLCMYILSSSDIYIKNACQIHSSLFRINIQISNIFRMSNNLEYFIYVGDHYKTNNRDRVFDRNTCMRSCYIRGSSPQFPMIQIR